MKTFFISIIVLVIIGVGGFIGYQYMSHLNVSTPTTSEIPVVTKTGVVQKLPKPGDDYTHMLKTTESLIKLNSYTVSLDQYVNKTITVKGQYSGDTLFVDSVK